MGAVNGDKTQKELIDLSFELLNVEIDGGRPLYSHELLFTLPSVKKALSLYAAIHREAKANGLIASIVLVRCLIEVVCNYCYVMGLKNKDESFYKKFLETGRLRRHRKGKGWSTVSVEEQIAYVEKTLSITKLQRAYDNCSSLVHYSSDHMHFIIHDKGNGSSPGIVVGSDEKHMDAKNIQELLKTTDQMMFVLKMCLKAEVEHKKAWLPQNDVKQLTQTPQ